MENASKALLIAGGILLTMLILALLVYASSSITDMAEAQDRETLTEQIAEFNKSYLAYNKTRMYGADVLSVYYKSQEDKEDYDITVIAYDENGDTITIENTSEFKTYIFKCITADINQDTGIIKMMEFKKISE